MNSYNILFTYLRSELHVPDVREWDVM